MKRKGAIRWSSVAAAVTTIGGIVAEVARDPAVIATLPGKVAAALVVGGAIWQAITKAIVRQEHERYDVL